MGATMNLFKNLGAPVRRKEPFDVLRGGQVVQDTQARRGDVFAPTDGERVRLAYKLQLHGQPQTLADGVTASESDEGDEPTDDELEAITSYATGGGWYEFPGAEGAEPTKVQGRDAAIAAYREMVEG